jgi:predicted nucleic acid-binding protein
MIAYFDSSSIVKWFFDEPHMDLSRDVRDKTEIVFTSLFSFPEVTSAIYRASREGRCSKPDMELIRDEFFRIWPHFQWVKATGALMQQAGQLIFRHGLRGYDAVHLASALLINTEAKEFDLFFSCFDRNLNKAAQKEGLEIHAEIR